MVTRNDRMTMLFAECERTVMDAIVMPFGLSSLIFEDKDGGYIDTIHNVRTGTWVSEENKRTYDSREPYDGGKYHKADGYKNKNRSDSATIASEGKINDTYSNIDIKSGDSHDLDHIQSAKECHDDPGRVLAGISGEEIANRETNLGLTNPHINRTKKAMTMEEYIAYRKAKISNIEEGIAKLEAKANDGTLTPGQQQQLEKLRESKAKYDNDGFNEDKAREADRKARDAYNHEVNKKYYLSKKFAMDLGFACGKAGIQMGLQQVIGLFLREFASRAIQEVRIICRTHTDNSRPIFSRIKNALQNIYNSMIRSASWKRVLEVFLKGGLGGMLSTLVTTLINAFATTAKNLVKAIRESAAKLVDAFKVLIFPPEGATRGDVGRIFFKSLSVALIVGVGVAIEGALHTSLDALPFGSQIVAVLFAILTGVSVAIAGFIIDCWFDKGSNLLESYENFCKLGNQQEKLNHALVELTDEYVQSVENYERALRKSEGLYVQYLLMKESTEILACENEILGMAYANLVNCQEANIKKLKSVAIDIERLSRKY